MGSQQWRPYQMLKTKLVQLFGGDELVVVIHGGSGGLLQLLCQAVKEGGPAGSRTKRGNVKDLQIFVSIKFSFHTKKAPASWVVH